MKEKNIKKRKEEKVQFFRPKKKHLKLMFKHSSNTELERIKDMAEDTIKNVSKYTKDKKKQEKMIEDAKKTLVEVTGEIIKRQGS